MSTSSVWITQLDLPQELSQKFGEISNWIALNSQQIFCVWTQINTSDFWIYDISESKWRLLTSDTNYFPAFAKIVFDEKKKLIYFLTDKTTHAGVAVYDLKSNSIQDCDITLPNYDHNNRAATLELIDGRIQIILGNFNDEHIECDIEGKECKTLHTFEKYSNCLADPASVYLQNKGELWLIGGFDYNSWWCIDHIHSYSITNDKWKPLHIKLPESLRKCTCICTIDERYIIIFGGHDSRHVSTDKIFIIDTELLEIKESSIKCPMKGLFHACLVDDKTRSDLIVNGFINECWNEEKFKNNENLRYPSDDIIGLIISFHCVQIVHLFERYVIAHWTIHLIDLLMS